MISGMTPSAYNGTWQVTSVSGATFTFTLPLLSVLTATGFGSVVSGYAIENGMAIGQLPNVQAKLDASRLAVELLHPGHGNELSKPIYVNWGMIPYNLGSWISGFGRSSSVERLLDPDGRVYFAGDHTSHLVGWQEGAALSAYRTINQIGTQVEKRTPNAA